MHLRPPRALGIAHRMQEMQHHAGILAHGTGDIAQHHQIGIAWARGFQHQLVHLPAPAQRGPQAAPRVDPPPWGGHGPAGRYGFDRQAQPRQHLLGLRHLREAHQFEIKTAQPFLRGHGQAGIDLDLCLAFVLRFFAVAFRRFGTVQQRLCRAFLGGLGGAVFLDATDRGQHRGHHMLQIPRVAPIKPEELRKDGPVFRTVHKAGVQRPVEIGFVGEPRHLYRADRVDHAAGANGQPGTAQGTGEMGDIAGEFGVIGQIQGQMFHQVACRQGLSAPGPPRILDHLEAAVSVKGSRPAWLWLDRGCVSPLILAVWRYHPGISGSPQAYPQWFRG